MSNRIFHFSDPHLSFNERGEVQKPMDKRSWSEGTTAYTGYLELILEAQKGIEEDDFQVVTGDLVHDMSRTTAPYSLHWLDDKLNGIVIACTGNHDRSIDIAKLRMKHSFKKLYLLDIGEIISIGPYTFGCFSNHNKKEDAKGKGGGMPQEDDKGEWYSNPPDELLDFAEQLAHQAKRAGKTPILISHYPPSEVQEGIGSRGIKAYLHGHVHCTSNKVPGGVDWQWYDRAVKHTDDKVFNGCYFSCGTTDILLAKNGRIMKEIPVLKSVAENEASKRKNFRDQAAIEFECHPGMAKPFSRPDPLNEGNSLTGFINVQKGPMQGSLYITHVNGLEVRHQLIYGVPKMKLPYRGRTTDLEIPEAKKYLFINKWNGMNVLFFRYQNAGGSWFVSAKSKGAPLLSDCEYGKFLTLTLKALAGNVGTKHAIYNNLLIARSSGGVLDDRGPSQSVSCELCGTEEPHLVKYNFGINLKALFSTSEDGRITPWLSIWAGGESSMSVVNSKYEALLEIARRKDLNFNQNEAFRKENNLSVKYEYNHFTVEGAVMYPLDENGLVISRGQIYKIKPKDIEEMHWQQFDGQMKGRVSEALVKLKDHGLPITEKNLQEELDMGPKEWGKFGPDVMAEAGSDAANDREVIILVGLPGSGKTKLALELEAKGYVRVNQDELGSANACKEKMADALKAGGNVVVDRTNINVQQRKRWIDLARKFGVSKIRCVELIIPIEECIKRVTERKGHPTINDSIPAEAREGIVRSFDKSYESPTLNEGFVKIDIEKTIKLEQPIDYMLVNIIVDKTD